MAEGAQLKLTHDARIDLYIKMSVRNYTKYTSIGKTRSNSCEYTIKATKYQSFPANPELRIVKDSNFKP